MKKFITLIGILSITFHCYSQCNEYFSMKEGTEWEYESFDKKGKSSGKQHQKVTQYNSTANGYEATLSMDISDKKGENVMSGELEMSCKDGVYYFDMRKFIPEEQLQMLGSYEMKVEGENLEYPSTLSVGQSLKDGTITVTAENSPMPINITLNILNRKVEAKETITTPLGTFETFKITSNSVMKTKMGISMTMEYESTEWLAKDVGVVKSESFRKGKSMGYTLLVKRN
jgi:hypothetical protein